MAMIEAYGLTKKFDGLVAVEDLSLEMAEGEVLAFLGPNGARSIYIPDRHTGLTCSREAFPTGVHRGQMALI